jgi:hypothetical protein
MVVAHFELNGKYVFPINKSVNNKKEQDKYTRMKTDVRKTH